MMALQQKYARERMLDGNCERTRKFPLCNQQIEYAHVSRLFIPAEQEQQQNIRGLLTSQKFEVDIA